MFSFKKLFGKNEDLTESFTYEDIDETRISIKFNSKIKKNYNYYENDLYDERGLINNEKLSYYSRNKFEIYQWIKGSGDFVSEGEVICVLRYVPYTNPHGFRRIGIQPPIKAPKSGILSITKKEDEGVINGEEICTIKTTEKPLESNFWIGELSSFYFNKYEIPVSIREPKNLKSEYGIPLKNYEMDQIFLFDWLIPNKSFVNADEPIANVGVVNNRNQIYNYILKSKVSGYIYQMVTENSSCPLYQDSLLCTFHKTEKKN